MSQRHGDYLDYPFVADSDLSHFMYHIVTYGTDPNGVVPATSASDTLAAVLLNKPTSGQDAQGCIHGCCKCAITGAYDRGDWLVCGDDSCAVVWDETPGVASIGYVLSGSSNSSGTTIAEIFVSVGTL